jgi:hypothetical protein
LSSTYVLVPSAPSVTTQLKVLSNFLRSTTAALPRLMRTP